VDEAGGRGCSATRFGNEHPLKRSSQRVVVQFAQTAVCLREIPCPAGKNAGLRDDAEQTKSLSYQTAPLPLKDFS
jgi:hypothetical protein